MTEPNMTSTSNQLEDLENQTPNSSLFFCSICYGEYDLAIDKTISVKMLDKCKHAFCSDCFTETFRSMIEDQNKFARLKCPEYGCDNYPTE